MTRDHQQGHPSTGLIERYADADPGLDDVSAWSIEAHLEQCPLCRSSLAARVRAGSDVTDRIAGAVLLDQVGGALAALVAAAPAPTPVPRSWLVRSRRWALWQFFGWLATTGLVLLAALLLDLAAPARPSLVLLLAPVAPLLGVAAAWNRRTDPAWELVVGSPRAGLWLLLRRTLIVLLVVVPVGMTISLLGGQSPVLWLLPCLGLTATTLALGSRFGVQRSAIGVGVVWGAAVLAPALLRGREPIVLAAPSLPIWLLVAAAAAALVVVRADWYAQVRSRR